MLLRRSLRSPARVALRLAPTLLLAAQAQAGDADAELARLLGAPAGVTPAELAGELAAIPGAAHAWIAVRGTGTLPCDGGESPLTPEQQGVLGLAIPLLPRSEVLLAAQAENGRSDAPRGPRLAALELLRFHASAAEVDLLCALALPGAGLEGDPLVPAFEQALADVLKRDDRAYGALDAAAQSAPPLRSSVARAVGRAGHPRGLAWLAEELDAPFAGDAALQEMERLSFLATPDLALTVAARLRPILRGDDPARRKHALRALGTLRDDASIPDLIAILAQGSPGERQAAQSALRAITGRNLPAQASPWQGWYVAEQRWLREEGPAVLARLSSESEAEVIGAVRSVSEHGLHRTLAAGELARLLERHPAPAVRAEACRGLERLEARFELGALARALADGDQEVRTRAHGALCALTGLTLPGDPGAWQAALDQR